MPRFCYLLVNKDKTTVLQESIELRDTSEAIEHGRGAIERVFRAEVFSFDWFDWRLRICSHAGEEVALLPISDAVLGDRENSSSAPLRPPPPPCA